MGKGKWSRYQRAKGVSADAFNRAATRGYREDWMLEKIARGEWLSPEEYARTTGRHAAKLNGPAEAFWKAKQGPSRVAGPSTAASTPSSVASASTPVLGGTGAKSARVPRASNSRAAAGARAAGMSAAIAAAGSIVGDVVDGEKDVGAVAMRAAVVAAKSGAQTVAVHAVEHVLTRAVTQSAARGIARTALGGNAMGAAACLIVEQAVDTGRLACGDLTAAQYGVRSAKNVVGAVGGLGGSALGAAIGTAVLPGLGTAVGGFVGGLAGSFVRDIFG